MFEIAYKLSLQEQKELLIICRDIIKQSPLFQKTMRNGAEFKYLCTSAGQYGWTSDKKGFRYIDLHPKTQQPFPEIPYIMRKIAIHTAQKYNTTIRPETALINWYTEKSTLGLHVDKTEQSNAPVISISLGDTCLFIKGGKLKNSTKESIKLESGDVLIMGGEHRYYYHGVKKILVGTTPKELQMKTEGRINITIRQVNK